MAISTTMLWLWPWLWMWLWLRLWATSFGPSRHQEGGAPLWSLCRRSLAATTKPHALAATAGVGPAAGDATLSAALRRHGQQRGWLGCTVLVGRGGRLHCAPSLLRNRVMVHQTAATTRCMPGTFTRWCHGLCCTTSGTRGRCLGGAPHHCLQ